MTFKKIKTVKIFPRHICQNVATNQPFEQCMQINKTNASFLIKRGTKQCGLENQCHKLLDVTDTFVRRHHVIY